MLARKTSEHFTWHFVVECFVENSEMLILGAINRTLSVIRMYDSLNVYSLLPSFIRMYVMTQLQSYCRILFMTPRMKIFIREKKVLSHYIIGSLLKRKTMTYKPKRKVGPLSIRHSYQLILLYIISQ